MRHLMAIALVLGAVTAGIAQPYIQPPVTSQQAYENPQGVVKCDRPCRIPWCLGSTCQPGGPNYGYHYVKDARGYMIGRDYAPYYTYLGPEERALNLGVVRLEYLDGGPHLTCTCFLVKVIHHCDILDDQAVVSGVAYPQGQPDKAQPLVMGRRRPGWWEGMFYPQTPGQWEIAFRIKRCQKYDEIVYFQLTPAPPPSANWRCDWMKHDCPGSCPD